MSLKLDVTPRVAREIERIAAWWVANRPAAPGAVRADLKATFTALKEHPGIGSAVEEASSLAVRRIYVARIRYWVYYRARDQRVEVLSVWHESRGEHPAV